MFVDGRCALPVADVRMITVLQTVIVLKVLQPSYVIAKNRIRNRRYKDWERALVWNKMLMLPWP